MLSDAEADPSALITLIHVPVFAVPVYLTNASVVVVLHDNNIYPVFEISVNW